MTSQLTAFISRRWCVPESRLDVKVHTLHGGLESAVVRAQVATDGHEPGIPRELVVKHLSAGSEREADVYQALWTYLERPPAVQVWGRDVSDGATYLYLEHAMPISSWPWSDATLAARVCRELARLHDSRGLPRDAFSWNYEEELIRSAADTVELAAIARDSAGQRIWRRPGDLRRVVKALPDIRPRLLSDGATVIHGDVHPGNVILRRADADLDVILIDWARARIGSPLEDIASWLHSLGCWEPQARIRHDTLMCAYLEGRRIRRPFDPGLRVDYWFASASNGLSGAIRYHLAVIADPGTTEAARVASRQALRAWQRVIRRAAALIGTNLAERPRRGAMLERNGSAAGS